MLVIAGIVVMIVRSFWIGLIVALVGLVAFGGFAKRKWYDRSIAHVRRETQDSYE